MVKCEDTGIDLACSPLTSWDGVKWISGYMTKISNAILQHYTASPRQIAVAAYCECKQLLLFAFHYMYPSKHKTCLVFAGILDCQPPVGSMLAQRQAKVWYDGTVINRIEAVRSGKLRQWCAVFLGDAQAKTRPWLNVASSPAQRTRRSPCTWPASPLDAPIFRVPRGSLYWVSGEQLILPKINRKRDGLQIIDCSGLSQFVVPVEGWCRLRVAACTSCSDSTFDKLRYKIRELFNTIVLVPIVFTLTAGIYSQSQKAVSAYTYKVSRYCLLALHGSVYVWTGTHFHNYT